MVAVTVVDPPDLTRPMPSPRLVLLAPCALGCVFIHTTLVDEKAHAEPGWLADPKNATAATRMFPAVGVAPNVTETVLPETAVEFEADWTRAMAT